MRSLNELLPREDFDTIGSYKIPPSSAGYLAVSKRTHKIAGTFIIDFLYDSFLVILSEELDSARKEVEFTEFFEKLIEEEGQTMFGKYLTVKRASIHGITPPLFDYSKVIPYKRSLTN